MREQYIDRRTYLAGIGAAGMVGVAGCLGDDDTATGTLATSVTDQPGDIADFESCVVTIVGMWLGTEASDDDEESDGDDDDAGADDPDAAGDDAAADGSVEESDADESDADDDDDSGREYHEFDEPQTADLVELQGENTQLVDERELDVAEYEFLQLDTDGVEAVLNNGDSATVEVPGNAPLKFNEPFEIRESTRTTFTADFTPVKRGQTERYLLQPVAQGTTVSYEEISDDDDAADENETDDE